MNKTFLIPLLLISAVFVAGYLTASHVYGAYSELAPGQQSLKTGSMTRTASGELKHTITELEVRLKQSEKEKQKLLAINERLKHELKSSDKVNSVPLSYPDLARRIDSLPDFLIEKQLSYLFDDDFVDNIDNKKEFSKNLLNAVLDNGTGENEQDTSVKITFSTSTFPTTRQLGFDSEVKLHDVIFAHIELEPGVNEVLVKWVNMSSGEILMFAQSAIRGGQPFQYVSLRPSQGWRNGIYRVAVYSANSGGHLLGTNSYRITSVIDDGLQTVDGPNYDIIQELVATGQAVAKK